MTNPLMRGFKTEHYGQTLNGFWSKGLEPYFFIRLHTPDVSTLGPFLTFKFKI
jgi:hypothetical protein